MAFPGIISRLHSDPDSLPRQLAQGLQTRAEAFWLPMAMQGDATTVLAALPDSCSLYLEGQATLPCAATTASWQKTAPWHWAMVTR